MSRPPLKATGALEKTLPASKPLRGRWIPDGDPKQRIDLSLNRSFWVNLFHFC